jgi:hypothetical protein
MSEIDTRLQEIEELVSGLVVADLKTKADISSLSNAIADNQSYNKSLKNADSLHEGRFRKGDVEIELDSSDLDESIVRWKVTQDGHTYYAENCDPNTGKPFHRSVKVRTNVGEDHPYYTLPIGDDNPMDKPYYMNFTSDVELSEEEIAARVMGLHDNTGSYAFPAVVTDSGSLDFTLEPNVIVEEYKMYEPFVSAKNPNLPINNNIDWYTMEVDVGEIPSYDDLDYYVAGRDSLDGVVSETQTIEVPIPTSMVGSSNANGTVLNSDGHTYVMPIEEDVEWTQNLSFVGSVNRFVRMFVVGGEVLEDDNIGAVLGDRLPVQPSVWTYSVFVQKINQPLVIGIAIDAYSNRNDMVVMKSSGGHGKWYYYWNNDSLFQDNTIKWAGNSHIRVDSNGQRSMYGSHQSWVMGSNVGVSLNYDWEAWEYPTRQISLASGLLPKIIKIPVLFPPVGYISDERLDLQEFDSKLTVIYDYIDDMVDLADSRFKTLLGRILNSEEGLRIMQEEVMSLNDDLTILTVDVDKLTGEFNSLREAFLDSRSDASRSEIIQSVSTFIGALAGPEGAGIGAAVGTLLGNAIDAFDSDVEVGDGVSHAKAILDSALASAKLYKDRFNGVSPNDTDLKQVARSGDHLLLSYAVDAIPGLNSSKVSSFVERAGNFIHSSSSVLEDLASNEVLVDYVKENVKGKTSGPLGFVNKVADWSLNIFNNVKNSGLLQDFFDI